MRVSSKTAFALVGSLLCGLAVTVQADTVYLNDGSVLKGELELLRDDKLKLNTSYAGEIELPRSLISSLDIEKPMTLLLDSGDEVQGRISTDTQDDTMQLLGEGDQAQPVTLVELFDIRPVDALSPTEAAKQKLAQADGPWSGQLQVGLSGSSGNSDNQVFDYRASTKRETEDTRLSMEALLHTAEQNNTQTEQEIRGQARLERDYSERAFVFGEVTAERDRFEDVDLRYRATVGPGYFFIQEPDHELKGRFGLGFEQERFDDNGSNNNLVFTIGYDYRVDLFDWFRFTHAFTAIPDVTNEPSKNYRLESALGGELPLGSKESLWRLRGEYRNEYDNNPVAGVDELDTNYLLSIIRDFE